MQKTCNQPLLAEGSQTSSLSSLASPAVLDELPLTAMQPNVFMTPDDECHQLLAKHNHHVKMTLRVMRTLMVMMKLLKMMQC
jgi:hypothetical protein